MKVFPPLLLSIKTALEKIFVDNRPADRALEAVFKGNRKLGSRDRRLIAETVYECVRWSRRYRAIATAAALPDMGFPVEMLVFGLLRGWENWNDQHPEWAARVQKAESSMATAPRAVRESIQDEIDEIGFADLGSAWPVELQALNETAPVDLRINRHRGTREEVKSRLNAEGVACEVVPGFPDALTLTERKNIFSTEAFQTGLFEVQDRSSQRVAPFLEVEGAGRVIDACAGAGGKTLHLASLMKNRGKIISLDIYEWKLKELEERARRDKFSNIETRFIDSTKVIKRLDQSADRVLLDVPCSGLGVLRRNPDAKLRLTAEEIARLQGVQKELLKSYSRMCKVGGKMVYATCSLLPRENLQQVEAFLQDQAGAWQLEDHWSVLPSERNGDGFFAARLVRLRAL